MRKKLSNFSYLYGTKLEKFYGDVLKAEYSCDDFPEMSKITVRLVLEGFLRYIAVIYRIDSNIETGVIVKGLKSKIPVEIYFAIQTIRVNGVGITLYRSREKKVDKQPIELLRILHKIFCWYLNATEGEKYSDLPFSAPNKLDFDEREIRKIKDDIELKEKQINNLREKIINLANESKNINELKKIIIAIKNEKNNQEKLLKEILYNLDLHKKILREVSLEQEKIEKKIYDLRITCKTNHESVAQKESQLIRAELDFQKLKDIIGELDENNSLIKDKVTVIQRVLELLRTRYDKILELTNKTQDVMESIEFTNDIELKKKLEKSQIALTNELNNEDKFFNQYVSTYMNKIQEIENKLKVFKEILNDRIRTEVKDKELYKSFLNLNSTNLRVIYSFVKCFANYNLVNKSRDWLSKYNICNDTFKQDLNKSLENLNSISDNQIRLILYYDLVKMSKCNNGVIYKRKEFIKQFDNFIDVAYNMLMPKKEFNFINNKVDSIKIFYLKKFINELSERNKNGITDEGVIAKLYNCIIEVNEIAGDSIPEKYNIGISNSEHIRNHIIKKPFEVIELILNYKGIKDSINIYSLILDVLKSNSDKKVFGDFDVHVSLDKFLNGPYRVYLFSVNNNSIFNNVDEIFPIVISEILIRSLIQENNEDYIENYNNMVSIWKKNQEIYSDLNIQRQKFNNEISKHGIEKVEMEIKLKNLTQQKNDLSYAKEKVDTEFNDTVLNSNVIVYLPSYTKYKQCIDKKEEFEKNKKTTKKETVMDKITKRFNDVSISELSRLLVREAKNSQYFLNENKIVEDLENRILLLQSEIIKNKKNIKEKTKEIELLQSKKVNIEKKMLAIKKLYSDMHEKN